MNESSSCVDGSVSFRRVPLNAPTCSRILSAVAVMRIKRVSTRKLSTKNCKYSLFYIVILMVLTIFRN